MLSRRRFAAALAALSTGCRKEVEIRDEIPIQRGAAACGKVVIRVAGKDDKEGLKEGTILFDFDGKDDVDGCCRTHGWIQHVRKGRVWRFDNGTGAPPGVTELGQGADSNPDAPRQPGESDRPQSGVWRENPWYGASMDANVDKDEFAHNPKPQKRISFDPGDTGDQYRTSLVCVDSGDVLFTWEWSAENRQGRRIPPPKI
jgi:hypothetical protein